MAVLAGAGYYFFNWSRSSESKSKRNQIKIEEIFKKGFQRETDDELEIEKVVCGKMTLEDAINIAAQSECGSKFKENYICNENTNTWWIDLEIEKEGCSPACVVNTQTKSTEINWRCTGLISQ